MADDHHSKSRVDWADPNVPVGNSPPLPRWPLALSMVAWLAWVAFLGVMAFSRQATAIL